MNDIAKFEAEFDLVSGRYVIDAKSIMGIFSLDISQPIDLNIHTEVNKYESDAIKDKLLAAGFLIVEPEAEADIYIVNTCSVTNIAQKKSRQMLRRAKKRNSDATALCLFSFF